MDVQIDRRSFLAAMGAGAIGAMSDEDKAEELEHYPIHKLDDSVTPALDTEEAALLEWDLTGATSSQWDWKPLHAWRGAVCSDAG